MTGHWLHIAKIQGYFIIRGVGYKALREGKSQARPTLMSGGKRIELCSTDAVAPGTALKVEIDDLALAVFNVGGQFYVTDDLCTHGPGSLSEGYIEDDVVECNFHNGQFNIRTGEVVSPPCMVPIKTYPTMVVDGKVTIEVS
jgi:nitrite reductase/ring-hydroxylating ferredoxin subunit